MAGRLAAVTGGTGFLGLYIIRALAAAGWQVRILARQSSARPQPGDTPIDTVAGDLSDRRALRELVDGADLVVHAAGLIKAPNLAAFRAVNAGGTANLVDAINDCTSAKHLILVSSMVAREPQLSAYAATKREGEEVVAKTLGRRLHGWTTVRPCAVYGPADKETLTIFRAATHRIFPLPGPRAGRVALIHAADVSGAIASLGTHGPIGRIFELTDQRVEGYAWPEIIAAVEAAMDTKLLTLPLPALVVRAAAVTNMIAARLTGRTAIFTLGKAREILHADWGSAATRQLPPDMWNPQIGLNDGFRDTVSWYRKQSWLPPVTAGPYATGITR
jgi:nucleoside-diphosphate-sugar epimerase